MRYYRWLRPVNWASFPERNLNREYPQPPILHASLAAACLIRIDCQIRYMSQLRDYLIDHPALIWLLGFPLQRCSVHRLGFDPESSLPTRQHFSKLLREIPNIRFQFLLGETVRLIHSHLRDDIPDFGQAISLDTKHIVAWVKENNPNTRVSDRYNKEKQPKGDPDCKLGFKAMDNQSKHSQNDLSTPTTNPKPASKQKAGQFYWGYGTGVVATKVPEWGEFVLAEYTQPFNEPDVSYFEPLMKVTEQRLGFRPLFGAFDAAFDAFYVYAHFHRPEHLWQQGFAAVPFSGRNQRRYQFDEQNRLFCQANLVMILQRTYMNRTSRVPHRRAVWRCPLAEQSDTTCPIDHVKWEKGGCKHRIPTSVGVRLRHAIDRESEDYRAIYDQRTATERVNSRAKELGIENPRLRNQRSIANYTTLIYVVINLRNLHSIKRKRRQKRLSD
jgi:hypothetical protein